MNIDWGFFLLVLTSLFRYNSHHLGAEIAEKMIAEHDEALRKALEKEAKKSEESKKGEAEDSKKKDEVEESKESTKDEAKTSEPTLESTETSNN